MSPFRLLLLALPLALAACSTPKPQGPVLVDRVEPPAMAATSGVLVPDRVIVEGSAAWVQTTVAEMVQRRAVTATERERAERTLASGAYLGDAAQYLRLTPANVTRGSFQAGTAYLTDAFSPEAAPQPFQMSITVDLSGSDGATAGLSVELRDPSSSPTGGTGQLLITLMDPGVGNTAQLTVSMRGAASGDAFEPVASQPLAARDWRGSHRLDLAYTPGELVVALDSVPLVSAPVRLDRPAGPVYVGAFAPVPTMGVAIVDWTFTSP